jgi:heme/copper-type cytochrome/quinol oxidase subunit 3
MGWKPSATVPSTTTGLRADRRVWALGVLFVAWRRWFSAQSYEGVELFGLYWHFVDVVWIILFMLIYLL